MAADGGSPRKLADGGYPSWGADSNVVVLRTRPPADPAVDPVGRSRRPAARNHALPQPVPGRLAGRPARRVWRKAIGCAVAELESGRTAAEWVCPQPLNGMLVAWSPDSHELSIGGYTNVNRGAVALRCAEAAGGPRYRAPVGHGRWSLIAADSRSTSKPGKRASGCCRWNRANRPPSRSSRRWPPGRRLLD